MDLRSVSTSPGVRDVRLVLMGFGNVARRFCEISAERTERLADEYGLRILVSGVATGSHGYLVSPDGVSPAELLQIYRLGDQVLPDAPCSLTDLIDRAGAHVLVESTPLEHGGATAIRHVEAALAAGLDVITVNKGPIAWDYQRLMAVAQRQGRQFRFEGVTMDGCPVYNLAQFCLPGDRIIGFRGVLNSTTNFVLDALADGATLDDAVIDAQRHGFAETDPSFDLDGHDAAAKVAALCNVLLDAAITPDHVERDSIRTVTPDDIKHARAIGHRLRVVCSASRADGELRCTAKLESVDRDDPMYGITGTSSALVLQAELAGTVEIIERDGDLTQTAYAIYADLLTLCAT